MKKRSIRLGAAAVGLAAVTVLGTAGTSSAASGGSGQPGAPSVGHVEVCAAGNYAVSLRFPDRNKTYLAQPGGQCASVTLGGGYGGSDGYEPVDVIGHYNTSANTFQIGGTHWFNATKQALVVTAKGTTANAGQGAYADVVFYQVS